MFECVACAACVVVESLSPLVSKFESLFSCDLHLGSSHPASINSCGAAATQPQHYIPPGRKLVLHLVTDKSVYFCPSDTARRSATLSGFRLLGPGPPLLGSRTDAYGPTGPGSWPHRPCQLMAPGPTGHAISPLSPGRVRTPARFPLGVEGGCLRLMRCVCLSRCGVVVCRWFQILNTFFFSPPPRQLPPRINKLLRCSGDAAPALHPVGA